MKENIQNCSPTVTGQICFSDTSKIKNMFYLCTPCRRSMGAGTNYLSHCYIPSSPSAVQLNHIFLISVCVHYVHCYIPSSPSAVQHN